VCECLLELAWNDLDRGDHARVLEHATQLTDVAGKLGESAFLPAVACVRALVSLSEQGATAIAELDRSLSALHAAGASRLSSIVQNRAAQLALHAGADARARHYAELAMVDAQRVQRQSEVAAARVTLAELALRAGQPQLAHEHLGALETLSAGPDLPARTARAAARVRALAGVRRGAAT
jgi:hypothetical protein